ncbi:MAG: hypothetical protein NW206_05375 [Hyphomonadaceae bacterium]|nr:hypothetical protein [Hyphomonadaceae bacterium]
MLRPKTGQPDELDKLKNNPLIVSAPTSAVYLAAATRILAEDMGFRASADKEEARFGDGTPAPQLTYGLIEYLQGLDLSECDLLELGGGGSTEFWRARVKKVTTLETNPQWAHKIKAGNPGVYVEVVAGPRMAERLSAFERSFDIIVIDPDANRYECAKAAAQKLAPGGFIILDNAEWHPNASQALRDADLIEIDFHDFKPCHHYRSTTSLYLSRDFRPKPRKDRLPLVPIGGKRADHSVHDVKS